MTELRLVQDPDRLFIEKLIADRRREFSDALATSCEDQQAALDEIKNGPWYLGGEYGYIDDAEKAQDISSVAWNAAGLKEALDGWTTPDERYAVSSMLSGTAFKGMHWGRTWAGSLVDAGYDIEEIRK